MRPYQAEFEATRYYLTDNRLAIKGTYFEVGQPYPIIREWMQNNDVQTIAIITAHNPLPDILSEAENDTRNVQLAASLEHLGYSYYAARGEAINGTWAEDSFAILNCDATKAQTIAQQYGQVAFLYIDINALPRLVYCK